MNVFDFFEDGEGEVEVIVQLSPELSAARGMRPGSSVVLLGASPHWKGWWGAGLTPFLTCAGLNWKLASPAFFVLCKPRTAIPKRDLGGRCAGRLPLFLTRLRAHGAANVR